MATHQTTQEHHYHMFTYLGGCLFCFICFFMFIRIWHCFDKKKCCCKRRQVTSSCQTERGTAVYRPTTGDVHLDMEEPFDRRDLIFNQPIFSESQAEETLRNTRRWAETVVPSNGVEDVDATAAGAIQAPSEAKEEGSLLEGGFENVGFVDTAVAAQDQAPSEENADASRPEGVEKVDFLGYVDCPRIAKKGCFKLLEKSIRLRRSVRIGEQRINYESRETISKDANNQPIIERKIEEKLAKNSLAGLPEVPLHIIIPHLGLVDRSSIASTCKRLYAIEAKAGQSNALERWSQIGVGSNNGIILQSEYKQLSQASDFILPISLAMQRIFRTISPETKKFEARVDLDNPDHRAQLIEWIATIRADHLIISHLDKSRPYIIGPSFINALPLAAPIKDPFSGIGLHNMRVEEGAIQLLYERMKRSPYSIHNLYIPINDAAIFAEELMGISNFSFRAFANLKFSTSFNNVEVYKSTGRPIRLIMRDGRYDTRIQYENRTILPIFVHFQIAIIMSEEGERENMKRKASEFDGVLTFSTIHAKKGNNRDETALKAQDISDTPARNSFSGLPEDLLRLIIRELGLKDRSSLACTCRRLFELEAIVGNSFVLETWKGLISFEPNRIRLGYGTSMWLRFDLISMNGFASVLQRILKTTKKEQCTLLDVDFDLNRPAFIDILNFISTISPYRVAFNHAGRDSRAIFNSQIIDALPWSVPTLSALNLKEIVVSASDMRKVYENARDSHLNTVEFSLPMFAAADFGRTVFGIEELSFSQSDKTRMRTSLVREKVYVSDHRVVHQFFMHDGHRVTYINRRARENSISISIVTYQPGMIFYGQRIPTVDPSA